MNDSTRNVGNQERIVLPKTRKRSGIFQLRKGKRVVRTAVGKTGGELERA